MWFRMENLFWSVLIYKNFRKYTLQDVIKYLILIHELKRIFRLVHVLDFSIVLIKLWIHDLFDGSSFLLHVMFYIATYLLSKRLWTVFSQHEHSYYFLFPKGVAIDWILPISLYYKEIIITLLNQLIWLIILCVKFAA